MLLRRLRRLALVALAPGCAAPSAHRGASPKAGGALEPSPETAPAGNGNGPTPPASELAERFLVEGNVVPWLGPRFDPEPRVEWPVEHAGARTSPTRSGPEVGVLRGHVDEGTRFSVHGASDSRSRDEADCLAAITAGGPAAWLASGSP